MFEDPHTLETDTGRLLLIWPTVEGRDVDVSVVGEELCIEVEMSALE